MKISRFNAVMLLVGTYGLISFIGMYSMLQVFRALKFASAVPEPLLYSGAILSIALYFYRKKWEDSKFSKYDKAALILSILTAGLSTIAVLVTPGILFLGYDRKIY